MSTPAPSESNLVWLDMEMTGLDPEVCVPVQVAIIITDSELRTLAELPDVTIWAPEAALAAMEPIPRTMHTENKLIERIRESKISVGDAEKEMMKVLSQWVPYGRGILCGNSIHQDRRFLRKYFPAFDGYLGYRMIDVSSLKELAKRWYGPGALYTKGRGNHTALADVRDSIEELKHYRQAMMKPAG